MSSVRFFTTIIIFLTTSTMAYAFQDSMQHMQSNGAVFYINTDCTLHGLDDTGNMLEGFPVDLHASMHQAKLPCVPSFNQDEDNDNKNSSGLVVNKKNVIWGKHHTSKTPAVIDLERAVAATPEAKKIKDEGIEKGSAQYDILMQRADARVKRHIPRVAVAEGKDCVIKKGCILRNPKKLSIGDITDEVISSIENE